MTYGFFTHSELVFPFAMSFLLSYGMPKGPSQISIPANCIVGYIGYIPSLLLKLHHAKPPSFHPFQTVQLLPSTGLQEHFYRNQIISIIFQDLKQ